jgi:1,4-dihydroxy-2-naphthoyl-CoA hydrolase
MQPGEESIGLEVEMVACGKGLEGESGAPPDPADWLVLRRLVRFGDTDAAGVMHFHQLLRWCHEAWEESLERFGIPAAEIFPTPVATPARALPVVHCDADYWRPLVCGAPLTIRLEPQRLEPSSFEVVYRFHGEGRGEGRDVARARLRHVAIDPATRQRQALPDAIEQWLMASAAAASPAAAAATKPAPG